MSQNKIWWIRELRNSLGYREYKIWILKFDITRFLILVLMPKNKLQNIKKYEREILIRKLNWPFFLSKNTKQTGYILKNIFQCQKSYLFF